MKARFHISIYLIIPILLFGIGCATLMEQGNHFLNNEGFALAENPLERALAKDSNNVDLALSLVDAYLKNNKFEKAEDLFARIIENPKAEAVQKLHYAEQLMKAGKYEQVNTILDILNYEIPDDPHVLALKESMEEVEEFLNSMDDLENYFRNDGAFNVNNVDFNSPESEFSPTFYKDMLVFASARDKMSYVTYLHAWDNQPFTNIYYSTKDGDRYTEPQLFEAQLQNRFHDGVVSFSRDGRQMYYTQNDLSELKERRRKGLALNLKISRSDLVNSEWTDPVGFKYNHPDYNCAHPTLSADGQQLYFSSDMPSDLFGPGNPVNYGEMDLYVCEKVNQEWGIPRNLGPEVNSAGDEVFPYINADGSLFFASNGHVGFGGLDLFHVTIENNKGHSRKNLGSPVNSKYDDFSVIVYEDGSSGFFCSDRPGGKGHDDIYKFTGYKLPMLLNIRVVDASTGEPIEHASLALTQNEIPSKSLITDSLGMAKKTIYRLSEFKIQASKEGYQNGSVTMHTADYNLDSIPLISIPLDRVLDINDHCDIFYEIDKYLLGEIPMNKIPPIKIAELINGCTIEFKEKFYSKNDIRLKRFIPGTIEIKGQVWDCDSSDTMRGVNVFAQQLTGLNEPFNSDTILKSVTCDDGQFSMHLLPNSEYLISTVKIGAASFLDTIYTHSITTLSQDIFLCGEKETRKIEELIEIDLKHILFDLNKWDIRPDAEIELDKIVKAMKDYPSLKIELGSHTDSRGNDAFNASLSQKRAKASVEYIVSKGITPSRITGKGYGETQLINHCKNGIPCPEPLHQENRRTEFIVTGMDDKLIINYH